MKKVWEPRAKSEAKHGSVGKTGVYMDNIAFCGERVVRRSTVRHCGRSLGQDWDDLESVGRMWYSSWVGREPCKKNEILCRAASRVLVVVEWA